MEISKNDEAWLAALNGTGPVFDRETRQASELRSFVQRQLADDLSAKLDPAMATRVMNGLRASGVLTKGRHEPKPSALAALMDWLGLSGAGGPANPRYAVVAGVAAAVLALPLVLNHPRDDHEPDVKAVRPDKTLAVPSVLPLAVVARDPQTTAAALAEALVAAGAQSELTQSGDAWTVGVQVNTSNHGQVRQVLAGYGFEAVQVGRLVIQVRSH